MKKIEEIKKFIVENVKSGKIGVATMDLYSVGYSVRNINAAIRQLLDKKKITISCPKAGFRLGDRENWNEKGVEISLASKNFDIRLAKS